MLNQIKDILTRPQTPLLEDGLGVAALFALLFAGLTLSGTA